MKVFEKAIVEDKLDKLPFYHQLTFGLLTAERMAPNYEYFSKNYSWGNVDILYDSIEILFSIIENKYFDETQVRNYMELLDKNIPETVEYNTILASSAMDACCVLIETFTFVLNKQTKNIVDVSVLSVDTVHMYIQEKEDLDIKDQDFDNKIYSNKLMVNELKVQEILFEELNKAKEIDQNLFIKLHKIQYNEGRGTLNLLL